MFSGNDDLAERCRVYLEKGPPEQMNDYVSGSMTEIIIGHGAEKRKLDPELAEMASIIVTDIDPGDYEDKEVEAYMHTGNTLVKEVLERYED